MLVRVNVKAPCVPSILAGIAQQQTWLARLGDWLTVNTGDRAGALAWKVQQGADAVGAGKAAAVVASTAAIAGGTAVHEHRGDQPDRAHRAAARSFTIRSWPSIQRERAPICSARTGASIASPSSAHRSPRPMNYRQA